MFRVSNKINSEKATPALKSFANQMAQLLIIGSLNNAIELINLEIEQFNLNKSLLGMTDNQFEVLKQAKDLIQGRI